MKLHSLECAANVGHESRTVVDNGVVIAKTRLEKLELVLIDFDATNSVQYHVGFLKTRNLEIPHSA